MRRGLCTGSGIHAPLAAAHAQRVVAVDINPRVPFTAPVTMAWQPGPTTLKSGWAISTNRWAMRALI